MPKVSICIPAYNAEQFIGTTVRSVLDQAMGDFELIVADDGSSDGTLSVLRSFSDPRMRVIRNERNLGFVDNWRKVVGHASGQYIKVVCHDDTIEPDCLAVQTAILDDPANTDVVLVTGARRVIDRNGRTVMIRRGWRRFSKWPGPRAIRKCVRAGANPIGEPNAVLFRADAFRKTGGFAPLTPWLIDMDMWFRLLRHGGMIAMPQIVATFRVVPASTSVKLAREHNKLFDAFIDQTRADPSTGVTAWDAAIGKLRVRLNTVAKRLIYRWVAR